MVAMLSHRHYADNLGAVAEFRHSRRPPVPLSSITPSISEPEHHSRPFRSSLHASGGTPRSLGLQGLDRADRDGSRDVPQQTAPHLRIDHHASSDRCASDKALAPPRSTLDERATTGRIRAPSRLTHRELRIWPVPRSHRATHGRSSSAHDERERARPRQCESEPPRSTHPVRARRRSHRSASGWTTPQTRCDSRAARILDARWAALRSVQRRIWAPAASVLWLDLDNEHCGHGAAKRLDPAPSGAAHQNTGDPALAHPARRCRAHRCTAPAVVVVSNPHRMDTNA